MAVLILFFEPRLGLPLDARGDSSHDWILAAQRADTLLKEFLKTSPSDSAVTKNAEQSLARIQRALHEAENSIAEINSKPNAADTIAPKDQEKIEAVNQKNAQFDSKEPPVERGSEFLALKIFI